MSIKFEKNGMRFRLRTKNTEYDLMILHGKYPVHLYYGKKVRGLDPQYSHRLHSFSPYKREEDEELSLDEAKALWDEAFRAAETDRQRMHLERSRLSLTYAELFSMPHIREKMSAAEQASYEAAVEKYRRDAARFGCDTNLFTARKASRARGGAPRPADSRETVQAEQ